jgi:hypothetical protein
MLPEHPVFLPDGEPSMPMEVYWNKILQDADSPEGLVGDPRFF